MAFWFSLCDTNYFTFNLMWRFLIRYCLSGTEQRVESDSSDFPKQTKSQTSTSCEDAGSQKIDKGLKKKRCPQIVLLTKSMTQFARRILLRTYWIWATQDRRQATHWTGVKADPNTLMMSVSMDRDIRGDAVCTDWGADNKTDSATDGCATERPVEDFDWPAWTLSPRPFTIRRDRLPENWGVGDNFTTFFSLKQNAWVRSRRDTIKEETITSFFGWSHQMDPESQDLRAPRAVCISLEEMFDKQTKGWMDGSYM